MSHIHNFNAGPAVLPAEVIAQIQSELPNYHQSGISILESSHRSKEYEALNQRAMERVKRLLNADVTDITPLDDLDAQLGPVDNEEKAAISTKPDDQTQQTEVQNNG